MFYSDVIDMFELSTPDPSSINDVVVAHKEYDSPSDPLILGQINLSTIDEEE